MKTETFSFCKRPFSFLCSMTIRMAQITAIPGTGGSKIPWQRAKKSLSDVDFENTLVFFILFIPWSSDCKKPSGGFSEILMHKISCELHHFPYFDPTKKSAKKSFSGIPYWLQSIKKNLRMRTMYFLVLVFRHRWSVGLMKSKIVKVKSF